MMTRALLAAMVLVAVVHADTNTCILRRGKKMRTFGNTKERIKFPCKYNAVRNTVCGNWKVTITPGNAIEPDKDKRYIVKSIWVGVEHVRTGKKWEGRSDIRLAQKYLVGSLAEPFKHMDGKLKTKKVFTWGSSPTDDAVYLKEKKGQFMIEFGQYDPDDTWHRRSGFRFECYHKNFVPSAYPDQICGNGTKNEVALFKKQNNWTDSRQATIFYNVFTNDGIVQTDSDCASTARAMTNRCKNATQQYEAARLCWPLVAKPRFNMCILRNLERSESAMRHCVEYVCSGFTDPNACDALSEEIDRCQELVGVSYRVRSQCAPYLSIKK